MLSRETARCHPLGRKDVVGITGVSDSKAVAGWQHRASPSSEEVVMWADGGGTARGAATRPVHGREAVAAFLMATRRFVAEHGISLEVATINASQGLILREGGNPIVVLTFETDDHQITVVRAVANPNKLKHVDR